MNGLSRRQLVQSIGAIAATAGIAGSFPQSVAADEVVLRVDDQVSTGEEVVVSEIATDVEVFLQVRHQDLGGLSDFHTIEAGESVTDLTIPLTTTLDSTTAVSVSAYDHDTGDGLAREVIQLVVGDPDEYRSGFSLQLIDADPSEGFHYPYFLYSPIIEADAELPILVEPNNTGTSTDDFDVHLERAESHAEWMRSLSRDIGVPMLVPVFPRPRREPVDWRHYIHALDRESMSIDDGPLERVDLQLLAMVDHAKGILQVGSTDFSEKIILNGFSASGNFVERFTVLHPERVISVTAGGLNGMTVLPLEEVDGEVLPFHVGIGDVEELTGEPVDLEALDRVNKFYYMGARDTNDTIPYDDAFSEELRRIALDVYGDDMIAERFPRCQRAYDEAGVDAQFRIYPDEGHSPRAAEDHIREFHRRSIAGEDVSDFGERIAAEAAISIRPNPATPDTEVVFDASETVEGWSGVTEYLWDFGDGDTAVGEEVVHSFEEEGEYAVVLEAILGNGRRLTAEETLIIDAETEESDAATPSDPDDEDDESMNDSTPDETPVEDTPPSSDDLPGFGIAAGITGLASAAYALDRHLRREADE